MDENARKRKRVDDADSQSEEDGEEELGSEEPKEGLNRGDSKPKKQKQPDDEEQSENGPGKKNEDAEVRKKLKAEKNAQKKNAQKEKKKEKEAARKERIGEGKNQNADGESQSQETKSEKKKPNERQVEAEDDNDSDEDGEGISLNFNPEEQPSSNSSTPNSPGFDTSNGQSGSSSISSIVPPANDTDKPAEQKPSKPTPEELKQRLQKRLDELRAARHADGFNGKPARNRQELIEARRQKAEQRKTHKKQLRQKAKEEEQHVEDEAMARRFSPGGSGSLLASPRSPADSAGSPTSYSFGRMVFTDGGQTDPNLSTLRDQPKGQGPQDAATALKAAESKKARLAGMDEEKRTDVEEKDSWLNAKKRAHGERVRDNTSLLKKALKRKESAKKKSEREWKDRAETVRKGKEARQTKREENLRSRREEKGSKGKKGGSKKKARPGFEGSFKTRVGGKK